MKNLIIPFEDNKSRKKITLFWIGLFLISWMLYSNFSNVHLFPSINSVFDVFIALYKEGLVSHIFSSLVLFIQSALIAIICSLLIVYLSPLPLFEPIAKISSGLRYLPLAGLAYYMAMLIEDARMIQISILSIFVSLFLITSILALLKDINAEVDHAKTLGCSKIDIIIEVVIKSKIDYVLECIRQNLAMIWMSIVMIESMMTSYGGLGFLIKNGEKNGNHGRIIALQLIILLVGLSLDYLITKLRKVFFKYSNF